MWKDTTSSLRSQEEFEEAIAREGGGIEDNTLGHEADCNDFSQYSQIVGRFPYNKILHRYVYTTDGFVMEAP